MFRSRRCSVLPGFRLTMGFTLFYLGLIVLIPLAGTFFKTSALSWEQFWGTVTAPRVLASYRLSFGASLGAALLNLAGGLLVAWVLVRYQFWGKRLVDALVDLPFALPTAVAGIALTAVYSRKRLDWRPARAARHQGRLHSPRSFRGPDLHRPAVCGPHRATRACGDRSRDRGSRGQPGRQSLADLSPRALAGVVSVVAHGFRFGICPCPGRVRLSRFHLRQHADENGDRAAPHHDQARAIRLRRGDRAGGGDAPGIIPDAACHQPAPMVGQPAPRPRLERDASRHHQEMPTGRDFAAGPTPSRPGSAGCSRAGRCFSSRCSWSCRWPPCSPMRWRKGLAPTSRPLPTRSR